MLEKQMRPKIYFDYAELTVYVLTNCMFFGLFLFLIAAFFSDLVKKHKAEVDL